MLYSIGIRRAILSLFTTIHACTVQCKHFRAEGSRSTVDGLQRMIRRQYPKPLNP